MPEDRRPNQDGLLGTILRKVAASKPLPFMPMFPALAVTDAAIRYGARHLAADRPGTATRSTPVAGAATSTPRSPRQAGPPGSDNRSWLDGNALAKTVGGEVAMSMARGPGVARGLWHTAEDLPQDLLFFSRLVNPADLVLAPFGQSAQQQYLEGWVNLARKGADALANREATVKQVKEGLQDWRATIDPTATPQADSLRDELLRKWNIGLNQGELGFDVGSLLYGGAELKGLRGMRLISGAPTAANYIKRGVPPELADYFALPYTGRGHHYWPLRQPLPDVLGGGPLSKTISESPFLLLKPKGITIGEFYKLHHAVDPYYYGGRVRKGYPVRRWSAKELKWKKYGKLGRLWHGAPLPLKMAVTSPLYIGAGVGANMFEDAEDLEGLDGGGRYTSPLDAP